MLTPKIESFAGLILMFSLKCLYSPRTLRYSMRQVNPKKPLRLKNSTKYFDPSKSRTHVEVSSPASFQSVKIKREGYESRLYWHFKYCQDNDGQVFFYTLTYNDKACPHHYDLNCFDYEDLRDLLTGGFRKRLLRSFGTKFKYFIGAELGDGKGTRGFHNNPHYHIIFFLEDAKDDRYVYRKITPYSFRSLVRRYWQGFDEDLRELGNLPQIPFQDAKYGIAKEGDNLGLVTDFRACMYCAKYCVKDAKLKMNEDKIRSFLSFKYHADYRGFDCEEICKDFFHDVLYKLFNIYLPDSSKSGHYAFNDPELIERLLPGMFSGFYSDVKDFPIVEYSPYVHDICKQYHLWKEFNDFKNSYIAERVNDGLKEWRNRYSNKVRISHGLGDYALMGIDPMNPSIQVPSKDGFKNRPIGMYYYRKLFTEVHKDKKGSNIRILNDVGISYKVSKLQSQIAKKITSAKSNLSFIKNNPHLFDEMRKSDINTEVTYDYERFLERLDSFSEGGRSLDLLLSRYSEYKLVYEDRYFDFEDLPDSDGNQFPPINLLADYERFLIPSFLSVRRSDIRLDLFLKDKPKNYLGYSEHPYFKEYIGIFHCFDLFSDYFFVQGDNKEQSEAEERAAIKRRHTIRQLSKNPKFKFYVST